MNNIDEYLFSYLKLVGFSSDEVLLFTTLLKKGALTVLQLSRETYIERTKIYNLVEKLIKDGLLEERLDYKRRYVKACDVTKIELILRDKIESLNYLNKNFSNFMSKINLLNNSVSPTEIKFYRGIDGIKQQLWNALSAKKEILSFSYRNFIEIVGFKFFDSWAAEFERRNLVNKEVRSDEYVSSEAQPSAQTRPFNGDILRYLPNDLLNIQLAMDIYNDTVALYNWNKGEVFGVEIVNKQFAELQKQFFQRYWNMAKPIQGIPFKKNRKNNTKSE
jgi:sugar-specific transcriptional regulator TrmB